MVPMISVFDIVMVHLPTLRSVYIIDMIVIVGHYTSISLGNAKTETKSAWCRQEVFDIIMVHLPTLSSAYIIDMIMIVGHYSIPALIFFLQVGNATIFDILIMH